MLGLKILIGHFTVKNEIYQFDRRDLKDEWSDLKFKIYVFDTTKCNIYCSNRNIWKRQRPCPHEITLPSFPLIRKRGVGTNNLF